MLYFLVLPSRAQSGRHKPFATPSVTLGMRPSGGHGRLDVGSIGLDGTSWEGQVELGRSLAESLLSDDMTNSMGHLGECSHDIQAQRENSPRWPSTTCSPDAPATPCSVPLAAHSGSLNMLLNHMRSVNLCEWSRCRHHRLSLPAACPHLRTSQTLPEQVTALSCGSEIVSS